MSEDIELSMSPLDVSGDLSGFVSAGLIRGVAVFAIDHDGTGKFSVGGGVSIREIETMVRILQGMVANHGQLHQLMMVEAKGNA